MKPIEANLFLSVLTFAFMFQTVGADHFNPSDDLPRGGGVCDPCDLNCDSVHDEQDVAALAELLVDPSIPCSTCAGDVDQSETVDGADVQPFVECLLAAQSTGACCLNGGTCIITTESDCAGFWLGYETSCDEGACSFANLTAYRPQHGAGYFPFTRTATPETSEESSLNGPGIRINAPGDSDPNGEDDLIELLVETSYPDWPLALHRTNAALRVWTTRTRAAGTELAFVNDETTALPIIAGSGTLTLWVEWGVALQGTGELTLHPLGVNLTLDSVKFHTFDHIVAALGGEGQVPTVPVDTNSGTFVVGISMYEQGFDVHMYDEDNVTANGSGAVYNEIVTAVHDRGVSKVAVFGYSHGGGSTYDLSERLDVNRAGIGVFEIVGTSYVDAVENDSDFDLSQELRRPPSTAYHANHYQVGSAADFLLDGGPVPNSNPPPTGQNVEEIFWGVGSTHFTVDDYMEVRDYITLNIAARLAP